MPLWLVIIIAGMTGCGFLFLKAREMEKVAPYKKVKMGSLTVKKAAVRAAKRPSGIPVPIVDFDHLPVEISRSKVGVAVQAGNGVLPGGLTLAGFRNLYNMPTYEEYKVEHPEYRGTRSLYYASHGIKE